MGIASIGHHLGRKAGSLGVGRTGRPRSEGSPEEIAKSLEGNWRFELLFVLRQQMELYRTYPEKISACDLQLKKHLESFGSKVDLQTQPLRSKPKGKKAAGTLPNLICGWELYRITGIDWAQGNGVDGVTAQTVVAECGADLSAFPSEKQFTSRLGLVPTNDQSSGKILKRRTRKVVNRAATAFRNAATTLVRSQSAQYRRLRTRLGAQGHHRHGSQTRLPILPAYQTRPAVCRQRDGIL